MTPEPANAQKDDRVISPQRGDDPAMRKSWATASHLQSSATGGCNGALGWHWCGRAAHRRTYLGGVPRRAAHLLPRTYLFGEYSLPDEDSMILPEEGIEIAIVPEA